MTAETTLIDFSRLWSPPQLESLGSFSDDLIKQFDFKQSFIQTEYKPAIEPVALAKDKDDVETTALQREDNSDGQTSTQEEIEPTEQNLVPHTPDNATLSVDSCNGTSFEENEENEELDHEDGSGDSAKTTTSLSDGCKQQDEVDRAGTDDEEGEEEEEEEEEEVVEHLPAENEQIVNTSTTTAVTMATTTTAVTQVRMGEEEEELDTENPSVTVVPSVAASEDGETVCTRRPNRGLLRKSSAFLRQKVLKRASKDAPITPPLPSATTANIRQFPPKPIQYGTVDPPSDIKHRVSMPPAPKSRSAKEEDPIRRQSESQIVKPKRRLFFALFSR